MTYSLRSVVRSFLLICGLALGGCAAMNGTAPDQTGMASNATTQPASGGSAVAASATQSNGTDNSYIGNGAFGEASVMRSRSQRFRITVKPRGTRPDACPSGATAKRGGESYPQPGGHSVAAEGAVGMAGCITYGGQQCRQRGFQRRRGREPLPSAAEALADIHKIRDGCVLADRLLVLQGVKGGTAHPGR